MPMDQAESQVAREWDSAEQAIKLAESLGRSAVTPAISELRYAGRRIVDAMRTDDPEIKARHLSEASQFCLRARGDAFDASIIVMRDFASRIRIESLLPPDRERYFEFKSLLDEALAVIVSARENRERRDESYRQAEMLAPKLHELHQALSTSQAANTRRPWFAGLAKQSAVFSVTAILGALISAVASLPLERVFQFLRGLLQ